MKKSSLLFLLACAFSSCPAESPAPSDLQNQESDLSLSLPEGFSLSVFAILDGLPRHLAASPSGVLYAHLRNKDNGGCIAALRDADGDGVAEQKAFFGEICGTGIEVFQGHLYYSSLNEVWRVALPDTGLVPTAQPELVVGGFIKKPQHGDKTFTISPEGRLFVNSGAPSNACQELERTKGSPGMDPCPLLERHGGIWEFDAKRLGQDQMKDGKRFATGLRNCVALDWNPASQALYLAQHGRDQLQQFWPESFTEEQSMELPAEEFMLAQQGDDFGWPYCYYDPLQNKKVLGPEYGGDGKKIGRCSDCKDPLIGFPAHWAPNDLLFYRGRQFPEPYQGGAFIAFHGSWNRNPGEQKGYRVVFVPFAGERPKDKSWEDFADGFMGPKPIKDRAKPNIALRAWRKTRKALST
ncbi:MAG: sorbosone dehydrogenase [Cytophagales bacterium]|nr:sorbosone dehydrogenase [Cytophagales bacterium]